MKEFLKRFGIIFVFAGVIVLAYSEFNKMESNVMLMISGGLILLGFMLYVIFNNILD